MMVASQWKMSSSALGPALQDVGGSFWRSCCGWGTRGWSWSVGSLGRGPAATVAVRSAGRFRGASKRGTPRHASPSLRFARRARTARKTAAACDAGAIEASAEAHGVHTHLELLGDALRSHRGRSSVARARTSVCNPVRVSSSRVSFGWRGSKKARSVEKIVGKGRRARHVRRLRATKFARVSSHRKSAVKKRVSFEPSSRNASQNFPPALVPHSPPRASHQRKRPVDRVTPPELARKLSRDRLRIHP